MVFPEPVPSLEYTLENRIVGRCYSAVSQLGITIHGQILFQLTRKKSRIVIS